MKGKMNEKAERIKRKKEINKEWMKEKVEK